MAEQVRGRPSDKAPPATITEQAERLARIVANRPDIEAEQLDFIRRWNARAYERAREAGLPRCPVCGHGMVVYEPGQITHPGCDRAMGGAR